MNNFDEQLANPIKIEVGQKIDKPGIYDIPIDWYHQQCTIGHSVSSSGLRLLEQGSPLHYWEEYLNPEQEEKEQQDYFALGQAVHLLFLGEAGFNDLFSIRPDTYFNEKDGCDKPWSNNATVCKAWNAEQKALGKYILKSSDLKNIENMARVIGKDREIREQRLLGGYTERSLIWQDKQTGIWLKSRPDIIPPIENIFGDLKTAGRKATRRFCENAIHEHGYHMQVAMVNMAMEALFGRSIEEFYFVFQETSKPWAYNVKSLDQRAIYLGECQNRRAINLLATCMEVDEWPTYEDNGSSIGLPHYADTKLQKELDDKLLPDVMSPMRIAAE